MAMLAPPSYEDVIAARDRAPRTILRTPLVPAFKADGVHLKLECMQPLGSFKLRGAFNVLRARAGGAGAPLVTASAGNFGQALAYAAALDNRSLEVHVPANAAETKKTRLRALGAHVVEHPFDGWWRIMSTRDAGRPGEFVHPVCEPEVIAGAGVIGLELLEDLPDIDTVYAPFGGGGLAVGIAAVLKHVEPRIRVVAVECETATPLAAAFAAGAPVVVTREPSFVDGIGSTRVLDDMWPAICATIDNVATVSVLDVEDAIARLARDHNVIAEGAGAAAFAAALSGSGGRAAAIISGGNLDLGEFSRILARP